MKKKQFRFVYSFSKDETPDSFHVQSNNVTNARKEWDKFKKETDILLAIFCGSQEIWKNQEESTSYNFSVI